MQDFQATVWEHLDDLRRTILRSFLIIGVGFLILLIFYQPIIEFLTHSFKLTEQNLVKRNVQRIEVFNQTTQYQLFKLPAHSHLISKAFSLPEDQNQDSYLLAPGDSLVYEQAFTSSFLIMGPLEGLALVFKVCFWLSIGVTAPFWGWTWLEFILPGLKDQERALLFPFLFCSLIFLGIGVLFAYSVTLPLSNQYLLLFNHSIGQNAWTLSLYLHYVLFVCLGHAIAAELSLLLLMLVHFRFVSANWLIEKRRYMIVCAFILGAILTPPDILTQFLLAIPLIALYEMAIGYAKWRAFSISVEK